MDEDSGFLNRAVAARLSRVGSIISSFAARGEWRLLAALPRAAPGLTVAWVGMILARAGFPMGFVLAMGNLVGAIARGEALGQPLVILCVVFIGTHVTPPLLVEASQNLGDRVATWLNNRLMTASLRPNGVAHLERSEITDQLVRARDFDLAFSGPPMSIGMGLIASGLAQLATGVGMCAILFGYRWWVPVALLAAWGSTHWLLHRTAVWRGRSSVEATRVQREADYTYRIAVEPAAAKEIRVFGLSEWVVGRFERQRRRLMELRLESTRLRKWPIASTSALLAGVHLVILGVLARDLMEGRIELGEGTAFLMALLGASGVGFGGLNYIISMFGQVVEDVVALESSMSDTGYLPQGVVLAEAELPREHLRFRDVYFRYPVDTGMPVLKGLDLTVPAGSSLAIVGANGAGKTTIAKLLGRLYDPDAGLIEVDGVDIRSFEIESWRRRVAVVYQDFIRYDASLRDNVAPLGAPDEVIRTALEESGADSVAGLEILLGRGYSGSTDLSGGQWQRVAIARALCAVRMGARVVVLDEPTAQLDIRAESEIFDRILKATESCTTILISHRFATVRHADTICVIDDGEVVERGSHAELMALKGRYRKMFDLQAARFDEEQHVKQF